MRNRRRRLSLAFIVTSVLWTGAACTKAPPNLTPAASWAFNETRTIKGLDTLRDIIIVASEQHPPVVRQSFMLATVAYHRSALVTVHAHAAGWQVVVKTGADELVKNLPANEAQLAKPYVSLLKVILAEVK